MMNIVNDEVISAATNTGTVVSDPILAKFFTSMSAQATFSANDAAGSFKIQASNDATNPTNWNDVPNTSQAVSSGADSLIPSTIMCYQWVRLAFVSSGGTGTVTARFKALEAS